MDQHTPRPADRMTCELCGGTVWDQRCTKNRSRGYWVVFTRCRRCSHTRLNRYDERPENIPGRWME